VNKDSDKNEEPILLKDILLQLQVLEAKVQKHSEIIEKFRQSFKNLEAVLMNLKERNRLR